MAFTGPNDAAAANVFLSSEAGPPTKGKKSKCTCKKGSKKKCASCRRKKKKSSKKDRVTAMHERSKKFRPHGADTEFSY